MITAQRVYPSITGGFRLLDLCVCGSMHKPWNPDCWHACTLLLLCVWNVMRLSKSIGELSRGHALPAYPVHLAEQGIGALSTFRCQESVNILCLMYK